jgi:hypothetical protein
MAGASEGFSPGNVYPETLDFPPKSAMTTDKGFFGNLSPKEKLGYGLAGTAGLSLLGGMGNKGVSVPQDKGTIRPYEYTTAMRPAQAGRSQFFEPVQYDLAGRTTSPMDTSERTYFDQGYKALPTYEAANGGEVPPNLNLMPPGGLSAIQGMREGYSPMTTVGGDIPQFSMGGIPNYAGGHLLKGPGDGVSDDIPATINGTQPARLADGEFVVPARIVSELGNGSTDAGAKRLYDMMDRVQADRKKSIGKDKVAVDAKARKHLPA